MIKSRKNRPFLSVSLFFMLFLGITSSSASLIAPFSVIIPNPEGLNSQFHARRWLDMDNLSLVNGSLFVNDTYMFNVTGGSNAVIQLYHLFDGFGVQFKSNIPIEVTLNCSDLGEPVFLIGNISYTYSGATLIASFNVSTGMVYVFWDIGASVFPNYQYEGFVHSWENYKTMYGFGLLIGYTFNTSFFETHYFIVSVFCENGFADIELVDLLIGSTVRLRYDGDISEVSDSQNYMDIDYGHSWADYKSSTQILTVRFAVVVRDYSPRMEQQNTTVYVNSTLEGQKTFLEQNTFFIAQPEVTQEFIEPWFPIMFAFGIGGLILMVAGPSYGMIKIKKKEYHSGLVWGTIYTAVGFALVLGWLWS